MQYLKSLEPLRSNSCQCGGTTYAWPLGLLLVKIRFSDSFYVPCRLVSLMSGGWNPAVLPINDINVHCVTALDILHHCLNDVGVIPHVSLLLTVADAWRGATPS